MASKAPLSIATQSIRLTPRESVHPRHIVASASIIVSAKKKPLFLLIIFIIHNFRLEKFPYSLYASKGSHMVEMPFFSP
jgi:hypothetical protein